jgi:hypothetical protein
VIRLSRFAAAAVLIVLAGCAHPTYFAEPLSAPGQAAYDQRLIGTWVSALEDGGTIVLAIEDRAAEGQEPFLSVAALVAGIESAEEADARILLFERVAHASEVDGEVYYNIRTTGTDGLFAVMDSQGTRSPSPDEVDWFVTPDYADREYWIARADLGQDGALNLRFISAEHWKNAADRGAELADFVSGLGGGFATQSESCGEYCSRSRVTVSPGTLAGIIRDYPAETVFNLTAGPFLRADTALPEFSYDLQE